MVLKISELKWRSNCGQGNFFHISFGTLFAQLQLEPPARAPQGAPEGVSSGILVTNYFPSFDKISM
jgi:hypothetical protein